MSDYHINRIASVLDQTFSHVIDMTDWSGRAEAQVRAAFLSRALASVRDWRSRRRETFQRLNAVAGAVAHFQRRMMMDSRSGGQGHAGGGDSSGDRGLPRRLQPAHLPGMRINGVRVATWSSQHGWSGPMRSGFIEHRETSSLVSAL
jgi:hypothetical protein